jgi:hypothetical protein
MGDQRIAKQLIIHRTAQTQNKHKQTSMPRDRVKPTTPEFERAKKFHALDCAATVIGRG